MAQYVDGFVIPVPKKNVKAYQKLAEEAAKIWIEYGALDYRECLGDDLKVKEMTPFPKLAGAKPSETVIFAWIVYKNKAARNRVNAKVCKDPRLDAMMKGKKLPFDMRRMACGGFTTLVEASAK